MKKAAAVLLIALGIIAWYFWKTKSPVPVAENPPVVAPATGPATSPASNIPAAIPAAPVAAAAQEVIPPSASGGTSAATGVSDLPPLTVLDNARVAIHNYNDVFGENPVGDNSEITAALKGKNPKQVNFIREDAGLRVNDKGELIDAWGTPFFFHQLSGQVMEIRSAGVDKKMWTIDDEVTK